MRAPLPLVLGLAGLLTVGGCSSGSNAWQDYWELARGAFGRNPGISIEQAGAIPYASLGYRIDGGSQALLVLATDDNNELLWTAASRVVLVTRDGRITRSVGLPHDISRVMAAGAPSLPPLADARRQAYRSMRTIDLPDMGAYSVALTCVTAARGRQLITILGTAIVTDRIDETCTSNAPRWSFTNSYWIDEANFAWRSVQNLHPSGTRIQIEIFRPPG